MRMTLKELRHTINETKYSDKSYEDIHEVFEELLSYFTSEFEYVKEEPDPRGLVGELYAEDDGKHSIEEVVETTKSIVWLVCGEPTVRETHKHFFVENDSVYVQLSLRQGWSPRPKFHVVVGNNDVIHH